MTIRVMPLIIMFSCTGLAQGKPELGNMRSIDKYTAEIDSSIHRHTMNLQLFAKVSGKRGLVTITDPADWPEQTEMSYNTLVDKNGKLVYYCESPSSESGDWTMMCEHYFNSDGDVVLFVYSVSGFNSECTSVLRQEIKLYFDQNFSLIGQSSKMMDEDFKAISSNGCVNYKFPFQVYPESSDIPALVLGATKGLK